MPTSFVFKVVFFSFICLGCNIQSNFIVWSPEVKLSWDDFNATPSDYSRHAALSHTGVSLDLKEQNGLVDVKVEARFDRSKSWKNRDDHSSYLLEHEQLHFNITELYARKMRKKILDFNWIVEKDWVSQLESMFQENQDDLWAFQALYDKETNHSLKREAQLKWDMAVTDSLMQYSEYEDSVVSARVR